MPKQSSKHLHRRLALPHGLLPVLPITLFLTAATPDSLKPKCFNLAQLVIEQLEIQEETEWARNLLTYEFLISQGDVETFLLKRSLVEDPSDDGATISGLLRYQAKNGSRNPHWVDVPSGLGLAQRLFAGDPKNAPLAANLTSIDVLDWLSDSSIPDPSGRIKRYREIIRELNLDRGVDFVQADGTDFKFGTAANLVTSIEGLQYFPNKLAAICNWYNQLQEGGVLVVVSENLGQAMADSESRSLFPLFLEDLKRNNIPFAINHRDATQATVLAIEKPSRARMNPSASFTRRVQDPSRLAGIYRSEYQIGQDRHMVDLQ